jgi:hypothetical protein
MNFWERLIVRHGRLGLQHKCLVNQVRDMREMQREPSALVREGERKDAETAVGGYIKAYAKIGRTSGRIRFCVLLTIEIGRAHV